MRGPTTVAIFVTCFLCQLSDGQLSKKGRKLALSSPNNVLTTTPDPFFDFGSPAEDSSDDFFDFGIDSSDSELEDEDCFFEDDCKDDPWSSFSLPPCDSLFEMDRRPGDNCDNSTMVEPEIRIPDPIFSRLISQVWADFQYKLNTESQLFGVELDPFDVDAKLPKKIDLHQVGSGYSADVKMQGIKMYGLSGINLDSVEVTRSENLTDFRANVNFGFNSLEINGTYSLHGNVFGWALTSNGTRNFSIKMVNATLSPEIKLALIDPSDRSARGCSAVESIGLSLDNVLIEEISIPLKYDDIDFKFENLGSFANTLVNGIGIYFLKTQEATLVGEIRNAIKKQVNSLIC